MTTAPRIFTKLHFDWTSLLAASQSRPLTMPYSSVWCRLRRADGDVLLPASDKRLQPAECSGMDAEILRSAVEQDAVVDRIKCGREIQQQKNCRQLVACRRNDIVDDLQQRCLG